MPVFAITAAKSNNFTNFTSLYNGNIGAMITDFKHFEASGKQEMKYSYDQLNRIISAQKAAGNAYATAYSYDKNGNLLTLTRNDSNAVQLHDFEYTYYAESNKLKNVTGDGVENYRYDAIGNLISDASENIDTIQWTVYGKVQRVVKSNGSEVSYIYDPSGNRVRKTYTDDTSTVVTRYVRDASGNVMAIYDDTTVTERPIYGSSRLGMLRGLAQKGQVLLGIKSYELSNHLGNVLTVITDQKKGVDDNSDNEFDHFEANIVSATDYYPFGLAMEGRTTSSKGYRWGFNGMERDGQIAGDHYDFGARIYNAEIGRWLSVDPAAGEFPFDGTYNFVVNTPIQAIDPDGKRVYFIIYAIDYKPGDLQEAAETRKREIEGMEDFDPTTDHVYMLRVEDFGKLKGIIERNVNDAHENGYGKTVEVSFFTHAAADGPRGSSEASSGSLREVTKNPKDAPQLSPMAWKSIDFNFDREESIASFYGCNSALFCSKFMAYQSDLTYAAGQQTPTAGSYNFEGEFNNVYWNVWGSNVYQVGSAIINDKDIVVPMSIISRDQSFNQIELEDASQELYQEKSPIKEVYGNPTVDRESKEVESGSR